MIVKTTYGRVRLGALARRITLAAAMVAGFAAYADGGSNYFFPNNLIVSRSVYNNNPNAVQVGQMLPPNCDTTMAVAGSCVTAVNDGTYPFVFNNAPIDASFGITSKIFLDQITPTGAVVTTLEVPNSSQNGVPPTKDQMVTSFSSKSEIALNLSTDHNFVTFMGYVAPIDAIDVSNANTPGVVDPTNPVGENVLRAVATVDVKGKFKFTETNAYSGNNGRAAILNSDGNVFYTSGNAGNGGNPQPDGVIIGAGMQIFGPENKAEVAQKPGTPTPVGSFNITQLGDSPDKIGKDTNFRGLTIFDNVIYTTKGSGGNGINTVYFVDTTGEACPSTSSTPGVGIPQSSATLPTSGIAYDPTLLQTEGVVPYNMCVLSGFPTKLKSKTSFPFGVWFANANTLYVSDEGNGDNTFNTTTQMYTGAAAQTTAGLQKWIFNPTMKQWNRVYTLKAGLALGSPYTVPGYQTGINSATGLPWTPATDGLRNITGRVNSDGTATIYAITSTVSGNGDQGADPNKLVAITDLISAATAPSTEHFTDVKDAGNLEVLRGVSLTPGS
jgi:hypothetical protein